jgi:hypothetical protein
MDASFIPQTLHGLEVRDVAEPFAMNGHNFLACHDTNRDDLEDTSIRLKELLDVCGKSACKRIALFPDSCESGITDLPRYSRYLPRPSRINQKTSMFTFDRYNREEHSDSAGIDLSKTDLSKGFDWKAMVAATPDGAAALDPRYGKAGIFNDGFSGRFLVKFIF